MIAWISLGWSSSERGHLLFRTLAVAALCEQICSHTASELSSCISLAFRFPTACTTRAAHFPCVFIRQPRSLDSDSSNCLVGKGSRRARPACTAWTAFLFCGE